MSVARPFGVDQLVTRAVREMSALVVVLVTSALVLAGSFGAVAASDARWWTGRTDVRVLVLVTFAAAEVAVLSSLAATV